MPVDSIITTIITTHIVATGTRWNCGQPKWNGSTGANQAAAATFSTCMSPRQAASTEPATMPASTATLARKPRPQRMSARIVSSTRKAMPRPPGWA